MVTELAAWIEPPPTPREGTDANPRVLIRVPALERARPSPRRVRRRLRREVKTAFCGLLAGSLAVGLPLVVRDLDDTAPAWLSSAALVAAETPRPVAVALSIEPEPFGGEPSAGRTRPSSDAETPVVLRGYIVPETGERREEP